MRLNVFDIITIVGASGFVLLCLIALIYLPMSLITESKCLEAGYPKSTVDYKFNGYCMNLEGNITVDVEAVTQLRE